MNLFSFLSGKAADDTLPDIFPIPIGQADFIKIDVQNIYTRILTDVLERTQGLAEKYKPLMWDNCLASEKQDGLVTLLSCAMADKKELYLVFTPATNVISEATDIEKAQIKESYKIKAEPVKLDRGAIGIFVTFKNYSRSTMVKFYSALEYCAVGGLWKQANISKSIQIKINDLRASVSLGDSIEAKKQAKAMADGMSEGRDILTDAKDIIESLSPDMEPTNKTLQLIERKQSLYLGMPASYFNGIGQSTTLSDTGKGDSRAIEKGLKAYFFSIIKPVLEGLFGGTLTFKSEDAEGMDMALKTVETMDRTSNEFLSAENKTLIVNKAFGLDESQKGDGPEEPVDPNAPPVVPGKIPDPKTPPHKP